MAEATERVPSEVKIQEVCDTADAIVAEGGKATIEAVRNRIGGSNTDISYAMKVWRGKQNGAIVRTENDELTAVEEPVADEPPSLDPAIRDALISGAFERVAATGEMIQGELVRQLLQNPTPELREKLLGQLSDRTAAVRAQAAASSPKTMAAAIAASIL